MPGKMTYAELLEKYKDLKDYADMLPTLDEAEAIAADNERMAGALSEAEERGVRLANELDLKRSELYQAKSDLSYAEGELRAYEDRWHSEVKRADLLEEHLQKICNMIDTNLRFIANNANMTNIAITAAAAEFKRQRRGSADA